MEQEKLNEVKFQFEQTKQEFDAKISKDEKATKDLHMDAKAKGILNHELSVKIARLNDKIMSRDSEIRKMEDELENHKMNKHFLDVLSIQSGIKKYTPNEKKTLEGAINKRRSTVHI
jgi:hypothetical protein